MTTIIFQDPFRDALHRLPKGYFENYLLSTSFHETKLPSLRLT